MSVAGNKSMVEFAKEHGVPVDVCGKLVVATHNDELPGLNALATRAAANGVPARMITSAEAHEHEPEVACVAALHVTSTAVIDFAAVCRVLADQLEAGGAHLRLSTPARAIRAGRNGGVEIATGTDIVRADALINCAGLQADRVARLAGLTPQVAIVPFRGEYFTLKPESAHLVRGLIYPVPDPTLPFLGVHLTRMLDGTVHAGPNAVLALRREGYRWRDLSLSDLAEAVGFPGLWRLARKYPRTAVDEVLRSLSSGRFARSLARLVPAVGREDLVRAGAGVRAQALRRDGTLAHDFIIETAPNQVHVLNAPSPGATCALEIAKHVANQTG
jgi:L-2-hydroxyglutarate oxidase